MEITSVEELNQLLIESNTRPVMLFKHSSECPISSRALREFESFIETAPDGLSCRLITVQTARRVSDEAASRLDVDHETPQAILIRNGRSVWNASHFGITLDSLTEALQTCDFTTEKEPTA